MCTICTGVHMPRIVKKYNCLALIFLKCMYQDMRELYHLRWSDGVRLVPGPVGPVIVHPEDC